MRNRKEIFKSKKLSYIILSAIAVSLAITYFTFDRASTILYDRDGKNPKAKGELLSTYLSVIGGCAVIYGLYLNNKRIGEQTRQNNITVESNNDKRFGDAVGYLNSDNVGIAIGGVYTLFQIAKEDIRYVPIVKNIFCEYIVDKPNGSPLHEPIVNNLIVKLVLDSGYSVFKSEELVFHDASFSWFQTAKEISNINFQKCKLNMVAFDKEVSDMKFQECKLETVTFDRAKNVQFETCELRNCSYLDCSIFKINDSSITNVDIINYLISLNNVSFSNISVDGCKIESKKEIINLNIDYFHILNPININAPKGNVNISLKSGEQRKDECPRSEVIIKMEEYSFIKITGDERFVEFIEDKKIWNYP